MVMENEVPAFRFATRQAIDSIISKFGWTYKDWMQDWPLEISDEIDIEGCLKEYERLTDEDEKFLLMQAVLYALDEDTPAKDFGHYMSRVTEFLNKDFNIHEWTIFYWTLYGNPEFEDFRITPLMREIWDKHKKLRDSDT